MKRCPTCDKTFEDALRFCQSDGTQLVSIEDQSAASAPSIPPPPVGDPFSTAEPSVDPLKTMVAAPAPTGAIQPPAEMPGMGDSGPETMPPSPFAKPEAPIPSPFNEPLAPTLVSPERVEVSFGDPEPQSVEEPPTVFSAPVVTFGAPTSSSAPTLEGGWAPPPAPVAGWGDQGIGSSTPFQPPAVSTEQNKTLAIVSLVCGILGLVCCFGAVTGIVAIVTGFIARKKASEDPARYGGSGMALAGIILGITSIVITVLVIIFQVAVGVLGAI